MRRLVAGEVREFTMEKRHRYQDGHLVWVSLTVSPLWVPGGSPTFHVAVVEDITGRKQVEQDLNESRERLRSIFRAAPGIGVVVDRRLIEVNERISEMTGYDRDELVGSFSRVLYPSDEEFQYVGREKYRQIAERGTGTVETRWRKKDGSIIEVLLSSSPLIRPT